MKAAAKTLLIPKMAPLLLIQLFAYGLVLLIAMGILVTKYVRPGLSAFGIKIITTADVVAEHETRIKVVEVKQKTFEERATAIEAGVRILVEAIAPEKMSGMPPSVQVADSR